MNAEILRFASIHVRSCPLTQDDMGVGSNSEPAYEVISLCMNSGYAGVWSRPGPVILSEAQAEPKDLIVLGRYHEEDLVAQETYVEKKIL